MHVDLQPLIQQYGALGVLIGMALESSIVPVPSEAVILGAGYLGIPLATILWAGALGSTVGGCVGYALGRAGVRWFFDRYGRWIGLTAARLATFDAFAARYGVWGVLIGRLIPIVPFKVFSIAAGMGKVRFWPFVAMTLVGVVPRILILALAGEWLRRATVPTLLVMAALGLAMYAWQQRRASAVAGKPRRPL